MKKKEIILTAAIGGLAGSVANHLIKQSHPKPRVATGQTVLITGASSGLGREFAKLFVANGFNLVITARSQAKLQTLAEELHVNYQVAVTPIVADLSQPDGAQKLFDDVQAKNIKIDQLINNAGAGHQGRTIDVDPEIMTKLINLNVLSVTLLCRLFGNEMEKQGGGKILNVASLGAFIPDPGFNVYGPTKAYELFLTEAMAGELWGSNVQVSVLCPGPTKTNWAKNAGKADSKGALDPADVAKVGFESFENGELVIVPTKTFQAEKSLMRLLPIKAQIALIRRWQQRLVSSAK